MRSKDIQSVILKALDFKEFSVFQGVKQTALASLPGRIFLVSGGRSALL